MRSLQEAQTQWTLLENCSTISELGHAISTPTANNSITQGLRSACWKAFLLLHSTNVAQWPRQLQQTRDAYESLRSRFLYALQHPNETETSSDPLSDDLDSPWDALRKDELLRQEINQDVDRCMPENLYFRRPETQAMLLDILFVWTKLNPDVGYRQGMHELLAPILWVVERDAVDAKESKTASKEPSNVDYVALVFDSAYIGHDSFTLFTQIMKEAKSSYETSGKTPSARKSSTTDSDSAIIIRSKQIMDNYLALVDPPLASHLAQIDIPPQLFLMRWIRLLFGREFTFDHVLQIWDRLFVVGNTAEHVDLICVAMLLRIRWSLIDADYNTALQYLLRYPELPPESPPSSLVEDAIYLKAHLDFDGGCEVVKLRTGRVPAPTNRPVKSPSLRSQGSPQSRRPILVRDRFSGSPRNIESLLNDAARGINSTGERWGVYKAVREVAGEVRKNVSTIQSKTHSRMHSFSASIRDQTTEDQLLRRVDALQARNQSLAKMLEHAVSELWAQHDTALNEKSITDKDVEAFTAAIAKVQFVQIYLEDSSLDLPTQDPAFSSVSPHMLQEPDNQNSAPPNRLPSPAITDAGTPKTPDTKNAKSSIPTTSSTKSNEPIVGTPSVPTVKLDPPDAKADSSGTSTPSRNANPRPPLEQSSFSWMLGQEPQAATPRSTFVSASPFSDHSSNSKRRGRVSAAFLFGDEHDAFESSIGDKGSNPAPEKRKDDESYDDYRLTSLRGNQ